MLKTTQKNFLKSGNLFLDKITDGISLGSIVLLVEDNPSRIYETFVKCFIAEGVVNGQKCFFYHSNQNSYNGIYKALPYKSTQVESILNAKRVNDTKSNEMKIAWRYENIKYSNLLEDVMKSTEYIFDLSRELQDMYITDKNKNILNERGLKSEGYLDNLDEIKEYIIKDYQDFAANLSEDEIKYARFVVPNLFSNDTTANSINTKDIDLKAIKVKLNVLKNIARSINGIVYLTVDKEFLNKDLLNHLIYYSDYVFEIKSFILDPQRLEDYDALFYVRKLPKICSLKSIDLETDTYGVVVEKRKVVIEKIDIGVEIDRNTKVKEKDITASQAMCGQDKYSKNYEF
jgi:hypothetical protein